MDWLFRAPTIWVHDSAIMLCSTCFLFGGAYALERKEHIRITVLYDFLGARTQRWCDILTTCLALVYLAALSAFTGKQAIESILRVERSGRAWDVPMPMLIRTMLFLGAVLLLAQALSQLVALIKSNSETPQ